jgi:hypothetical protein
MCSHQIHACRELQVISHEDVTFVPVDLFTAQWRGCCENILSRENLSYKNVHVFHVHLTVYSFCLNQISAAQKDVKEYRNTHCLICNSQLLAIIPVSSVRVIYECKVK